MTQNNINEIVNQMRQEANKLRGDTLVSMREGICNSAIADRLERWANVIEVTEESSK